MTATVMAVATPAERPALSCPLDCVAVYMKYMGIVKSLVMTSLESDVKVWLNMQDINHTLFIISTYIFINPTES